MGGRYGRFGRIVLARSEEPQMCYSCGRTIGAGKPFARVGPLRWPVCPDCAGKYTK